MRSLMVFFIFLLVWIVIAPGCMTFRKTDAVMKKEFLEKHVKLTMSNMVFEGHKLHYAKTGDDNLPTIVFVHGTPGSWDAFARYLQDSALLQHFRLVSIDRPGFGYSDFGDAFHLQKQSEIISPLLRGLHHNNKPLFLVGHSLGGPMVVKLAADNSGLIDGLVILAGSIDPAMEKPEKWRPIIFKTPLNLLVPGALRPSNEELWYLKKDLVDLKKDFVKIHCPVYLIHGEKDQLVPFANVAYGKKMLVNAASINELFFPEENHFIPWTKFEEIRQVLLGLDKL